MTSIGVFRKKVCIPNLVLKSKALGFDCLSNPRDLSINNFASLRSLVSVILRLLFKTTITLLKSYSGERDTRIGLAALPWEGSVLPLYKSRNCPYFTRFWYTLSMSYRYHSRRSAKRLARKSKRSFIITLIIIAFLIYATFTWILPYFIGGIGFIQNITSPQKTNVKQPEDIAIAPPVLNISYEATNTAQINIKGFTTPNLKIKLYIDDEPNQTVNSSPEGSFTFENVTLSIGTNNIYGKTMDNSGKESLSSKTIKLIYDNEKPTLSVLEPEDGKKIQGGDKKIKISGKTDTDAKVFVNGTQVIVNSDGSFSIDQPLNDGDNTISIKTVDVASNSTEVQRAVNYTPQETQ